MVNAYLNSFSSKSANEKSLRGVLQSMYNNRPVYKLKGLGLQIDVVMWIIVVLIIVAIVLGVGYHMRESARVASTKMEMDQIRNAILEYEGLRIDGALPPTLEALMQAECISKTESIDGLPHGGFLPVIHKHLGDTVLWGVCVLFVFMLQCVYKLVKERRVCQ